MSKLNMEEVLSGTPGGYVTGNALIQTIEVSQTKNGNEFLRGKVATEDGAVDFKIWSGELQKGLQARIDKVKGSVALIQGKVDEFNGMRQLIIESATNAPQENPIDYMSKKYNIRDNAQEFISFLADKLSQDGLTVFEELFGEVQDTFFTEFASVTIFHDNVMGGLTAHSLKCVKILDSILPFYSNLEGRIDRDLIYIGVSLHDVGKAIEYNNGSISEIGKLVSHRTLATEMAARKKKSIVELKGEEWYYRLISIFEQHHGEYEEKPRTVEAFLTHQVDLLESSVMNLEQAVEDDTNKQGFRLNGFRLN